MLIGGSVAARYGWRILFIGLGAGALLWLPLWLGSMPCLTRRSEVSAFTSGPGFRDILRLRSAWGTFLPLFCGNYAWYFLITWLPSYLVMERHYSVSMIATFGSLPFWGIASSTIFGGWASDRWIARGGSPTRVRKTFVVTGLLICTLVLPGAIVQDMRVSMALLIVACLSLGLYHSNLFAITQTIAGPEAAGKWTGWQNMFGNFAGIFGPWFTGRIVDTTGQFLLAFVAVCGALVLGAFAFGVIIRDLKPIEWRAR